MKNTMLKVLIFSTLAIYSITLVSCGEDDPPAPVAPELSITPTTFTGDIGDEVTVTVTGVLDWYST